MKLINDAKQFYVQISAKIREFAFNFLKVGSAFLAQNQIYTLEYLICEKLI